MQEFLSLLIQKEYCKKVKKHPIIFVILKQEENWSVIDKNHFLKVLTMSRCVPFRELYLQSELLMKL